jgi:hypothetical protein
VVPTEYFDEGMAKLNICRGGQIAIRVEPGENLIEAFWWNIRISWHFSLVVMMEMQRRFGELRHSLDY